MTISHHNKERFFHKNWEIFLHDGRVQKSFHIGNFDSHEQALQMAKVLVSPGFVVETEEYSWRPDQKSWYLDSIVVYCVFPDFGAVRRYVESGVFQKEIVIIPEDRYMENTIH